MPRPPISAARTSASVCGFVKPATSPRSVASMDFAALPWPCSHLAARLRPTRPPNTSRTAVGMPMPGRSARASTSRCAAMVRCVRYG
jgi:hypothetical protein